MIPYFTTADKSIGPIHWFGILVATGVMLGVWLTRRRAVRLGYDADKLESFIWWMLGFGFVSAHVLGMLLYFPEKVLREPWTLLFIWQSLASFPGFLGALIGILLWKRYRGQGQPIIAFADLILSVFPISWVFGRAGCTLVHDHPGEAATGPLAFLAVDYPAGNIHRIPAGPHWNLGLLEMLYAMVIAAVVVLMWRRRWPVGTYIAMTSLLYAPVRFSLDFLRTADVLYFGLTPGQYAALALFLFGVYMLGRVRVRAFDDTAEAVRAPEPARRRR
jgi:phosphatidylglycerol:prolipoprotein diacylglycerol transferase